MSPAPSFLPPVVTAPLIVLHADRDVAVIIKPAELLSCPGTSTPGWDSVSRRIPELFPFAEGPLLAHRLDAPTSGLMVVALTSEAHRALSAQFARRTVAKAYEALLAGELDPSRGDEGLIDLAMRGEWRLRPRQIIDTERGRPAQTRWRVLARTHGRTHVHFEPITGRTHQLRLHASDLRGLGLPIIGDRIYGPPAPPEAPAPALCLHATTLTFTHPTTHQSLSFASRPPFQAFDETKSCRSK